MCERRILVNAPSRKLNLIIGASDYLVIVDATIE